jgi:cell division protein FtsQ
MKQIVKTTLFILLGSISLLALISFAGVNLSYRQLNGVQIDVITQDGNYFIDRGTVVRLLNSDGNDPVVGSSLGDIDLRSLEKKVENNHFVKKAEVYKDLKGNLLVKVKLVKPIARIFNSRGQDIYIDNDGYLLPANGQQTARVPIIELNREFSWKETITETQYGQQLLELLEFIREDKFWSTQIAHLVINRKGEITMMPQVTKQDIEFGMPEDFEEKFKKLDLFYREILPNKGWNTYSTVNLKFKDQIICQK